MIFAGKRGNTDKVLPLARRIPVSELRKGDRIVTATREELNPRTLEEETVALKSHRVSKIDECPGQWRTHIHVNGKDCYDTRASVTIVDRG